MNTQEIIKSFEQFKDVKNIDKATLMGVLEEVLLSVLIKRYGPDQKINIVIKTFNLK
jgi:N utilization substance protein A